MYWSASMDISAPWRFSRIRTRGFPPAIRVNVRASISKIWIRSSAFFSSPEAAIRESPLTADERGHHRPLHHPAGAQNDGLPELVGCKTRPVAAQRFGDLSRFL